MIAAALLLILASNTGDPPQVRFVTKVVTKSWEPIDLKQVEKFVEARVLEILSKPGSMRLEKSGFSDLQKSDYSLLINGRFIEEAERFSVYLTFGKGKRDDLPSFHASHTTEALGRKKRSQMQALITKAAMQAASRMVEVLTPHLEAARLSTDPPLLDRPELPLEWGTVDVPPVRSKDKAIQTLLDVRNEDHERHKALTAIKGFVFDQQPARNAVEICLLRDPAPKLRVRCAEALKPVARNHAPTQRIILGAMRTDVDSKVLKELAEISQTFVGLSRLETIATWLHLVAEPATPYEAVREIVDLLEEEGDVANLDYAIAACLQNDQLIYGKKTACGNLLRNLPPKRRRAVVWHYLEDLRAYDQGAVNGFESVVRHITPKRKEDGSEVGELMLRIAENRRAGRVRRKALYEGSRHAKAVPQNLQRLVRLVWDRDVSRDAVRAVGEMARRDEALEPMAVTALERVRSKIHYFVKPSRGDPYKDLDNTIKRLKSSIERRKKKKSR